MIPSVSDVKLLKQRNHMYCAT